MKTDYKSFVGAILWLYLFAIVVIVAFFVEHFWGLPLADDPALWGSFADYIGGLINPIIGLGNLVLLVYVSFQLADRDDKRNKVSLKHEALVNLGRCLDYMPRPIKVNVDDVEMYYKADDLYNIFVRNWHYLIPEARQHVNEFGGKLFLYTNNLEQFLRISRERGPESEQAREKLSWLSNYFENEMMASYYLLRRCIIDSM